MNYRLGQCPWCYLTPIEVHDLPTPFPPEDRTPVQCKHCGVSLWAVRLGPEQGGEVRVVFRVRRDA